MKKFVSFFMAAAMLSLALSCKKDPVDDPGKDSPDHPGQPTTEAITEISASLSGAGIKTAWADGDAVIVYAVTEDGDLSEKYVLSAGAGTTSGTFTAADKGLAKGASAYYASYPYSSIDFAQHNTFSYTVEAEQTTANPIFAFSADGASFTFSSPLAGIELKLTGKGNAARIFIEDKNTDNIINGNATYNAKAGKLSMKNASASKNTFAKSFETVALGENATSFFFEVPASTLETGATVTVYNPANGAIGTCEIPAQNLVAGSLTTLGPIALKAVSSVADLSAVESANCYMITEPGTYKFRTVKGNSPDNVGSAASAEILWESYCNNEMVTPNSVIASCSYATDYVTFSTPETLRRGNAVIAVKDAAGDILWSWHIWVVADMTIEATTMGYEATELPSGEVMNYNLGALGEPGTAAGYGLLYAWGRKDPFLSAGELGGSEPATVAGVACTTTETQATVPSDFAVKNPTVWILVTGSDDMKDWTHEHDATRWGTDKGVHDPCPAGWRIPSKEDVGFLNDSYTPNEDGTIIYFNKYPMPYTRDKSYTSGDISSDGKYWTCVASGDMYGYGFRLSSNNGVAIRRKAEGNSVRCMKIAAVAE